MPELTPELVERIAGQSGRQSGACDLRDLERRRDDNLVAILRALKKNDHGAGSTIALHERGLPSVEAGAGRLPVTVARQVPRNWTDYNGHVNEAHCLELFAQASDRFHGAGRRRRRLHRRGPEAHSPWNPSPPP